MKFFDLLRNAWDPGRSKSDESPVDRATQSRRVSSHEPLAAGTNVLSHLSGYETGLEAPGSVPPPERRIHTLESVVKEIDALIELRAREIHAPLTERGTAGYYSWTMMQLVANLKHEFLGQFRRDRRPYEEINPVLSRIVQSLAPPAKMPADSLAEQAIEALIDTANLAGGDAKAFRRLAECQAAIQQLQELATALSEQNERLFTSLVLDSDKIQRHTAKPSE